MKQAKRMISLLLILEEFFCFSNVLFYVGATDKLPEPLSKDMEEYYLLRSTDGDLTARDKLIEHNLRLVVYVAKKYETNSFNLEDLISIGTIGCYNRSNSFSDSNSPRCMIIQ